MYPILIYGPRKSGTTLLHALLNCEQTFSPPLETKIKHARLFRNGVRTREEVIKIFPSATRGSPAVLDSLLEQGRSGGSTKRLIELDLSSSSSEFYDDVSGRIPVIKDVGGQPNFVFTEFFNAFPKGRILSLRRDPRMTARAVYRDRRRRGIGLTLKQIRKEAFIPAFIDAAQEKLALDGRVKTILYEDLVAAPERTMKDLCDFADLEFSEAMLVPSWQGDPIVVGTSSAEVARIFNSSEPWHSDLKLAEKLAILETSLRVRRSALRR